MKEKQIPVLLYPFFALCFALFVLTHPLECSFYIQKALSVCARTLIPSLFPFVFASKFIASVMPERLHSSTVIRFFAKLFGTNQNLTLGVLMGLFSGFPSGAVYVTQIYENGLCSKKQAVRAVCLSNNCSAAFVISVAGAAVLGSLKYGVILLVSQALSVIVVSQILKAVYGNTFESLKSTKAKHTYKKIKIGSVFTECIKSSTLSMLYICGFVIFFFMLSSILSDMLLPYMKNSSGIAGVITGAFFELSTGVLSCKGFSFPLGEVMCAFCICFPSLSVLFQIKSICDEHFDVTHEYIFTHVCMSFLCVIFVCIILYVTVKAKWILYMMFLTALALTLIFVPHIKQSRRSRVKNAQKKC